MPLKRWRPYLYSKGFVIDDHLDALPYMGDTVLWYIMDPLSQVLFGTSTGSHSWRMIADDEVNMSYPEGQELSTLGAIALQRPNLTEKLHAEKAKLEARLAEVNTVIKSLEENPKTQQLIDAIVKLGHLA